MVTTVDGRPSFGISGICWASVLAGAVVSLALTIVLIWFGVALGLSVVSPWSQNPSPTTFKIATGLYLVVTAMISSALGGHIAGRLRGGWDTLVHPNEVYFRDTANGFAAWSLATVASFLLLASFASGIGNTVTGGLVSGATQATASQSSGPVAIYVDQLLRPTNGAAINGSNSSPTAENSRGQISRLLLTSLRSGNAMSSDDRAYLAQVVSQQTGLSPADAQKRVDDTINSAKQAVEATRKAAMQLAYWIVASLLIGAFSASIAAAEAGSFRDRNWSNL